MGEDWFERGTYIPMDTTSLYYFQELAKDLHMTHTAERLYISQQTLSNHIIRLEKQLGCKLFNRKPSPCLTYAGEQVLSFAKSTLRDQANLLDILADVENQMRGCIRFGASTLRMNASLPVILPHFSAEYPYVELHLTDQTSRRLEPMILNGELDFALVAGSGDDELRSSGKESDHSSLLREPMIRDRIYLCCTDEILHRYLGEQASETIIASRQGADLKDFRPLPFMLLQNHMGQLIRMCFDEAGYQPWAYLNSPYTQIITKIGLRGTAAFFSTGVVLSSQPKGWPADMHAFPLLYKGEPLYQAIYLLYRRNRYVPRYELRFLELLRECFHYIEDRSVENHSVDGDS